MPRSADAGQTVRELRTERGMTQQQLADLCELHRTFITSIEKGRRNASRSLSSASPVVRRGRRSV